MEKFIIMSIIIIVIIALLKDPPDKNKYNLN